MALRTLTRSCVVLMRDPLQKYRHAIPASRCTSTLPGAVDTKARPHEDRTVFNPHSQRGSMNATDCENNATPPHRRPWHVLASSILMLAITAGCGSAPFGDAWGGLPANTERALSPNGQQLLVSWRDGSDRAQAKLLALSESTVTASPLPSRLSGGAANGSCIAARCQDVGDALC